jgi:hypothetical protein
MSAFENESQGGEGGAGGAGGWTEEWDETYQCYFFFHAESGQSSWERPEGLPESEDAKALASQRVVVSSTQENVEIPSDITDDVVTEAANWTVAWDDNYNSEFYVHAVTGETVWEKPACLVALQSQDEIKEDSAASVDPVNWSVEWDASYGCNFYFNTVTQESSWDRPPCLGEVIEVEEKSDDKEETDVEKEESKDTVGDVAEQLSKVEVVASNVPPKRRNSVMRRPSARPDMIMIKKAGVVGNAPLNTPLAKVSEDIPDTDKTTVAETVEEAVETTAPVSKTPKRRQSMAPRPVALPPKPLFVPLGNEGVILEGDEEDDDDEENDVVGKGSLKDQKLLSSEGINVIMQSTRHLDVTGGGNGDIEVVRKKPRAIGTYLMKKSPALMKGWQKRYVVLKEGQLKYYGSVSASCYEYLEMLYL